MNFVATNHPQREALPAQGLFFRLPDDLQVSESRVGGFY